MGVRASLLNDSRLALANMTTKQCITCKETKLATTEFFEWKNDSQKLAGVCKICRALRKKLYYQNNKEKLCKRTHFYQQKNKDKIRKRKRLYYKNNKEKTDKRQKIYRQKPETKKIRNQWFRERRRIYPQFRLSMNMGSAICRALKQNKVGRHWEVLVDYTLSQLKHRLESQFDNKMTWKNYGTYWEIHHIKPQSLFNFITSEDKKFKECWALSNLQSLEIGENRSRGNSYTEPVLN